MNIRDLYSTASIVIHYNPIHKSKLRNVNQYKSLYNMRWMKLLSYSLLIFGISCLLWRLHLRWYGVWVLLGSKGLVGGLGGVGFYRITLRQLRQRYRWYQLSLGYKSLGECCGAGKHLDAVYICGRGKAWPGLRGIISLAITTAWKTCWIIVADMLT